jgi:hypothetical protein
MKFRLDVEVDTSNGRHCKALGGSCCTFLRDDECDLYQRRAARFSCGLFDGGLKDESDLPVRNAECLAAEDQAFIAEKMSGLMASFLDGEYND